MPIIDFASDTQDFIAEQGHGNPVTIRFGIPGWLSVYSYGNSAEPVRKIWIEPGEVQRFYDRRFRYTFFGYV